MSLVHKRGNAEIQANLTPMIDVTFLLIVFFVLVSQIVEVENVEMNLPQPADAATAVPGEENRAVINVIPGVRGQVRGYRLGTRVFPPGSAGIEAMVERLGTLLQANPRLAVNLRADRSTHYSNVEPVLQAISDAAATVEDNQVRPRVNLVVIRDEP